jgi:hypothetical protein
MEKEDHRYKGGVGGTIMKKAIIPLVLSVLFSTSGHGQTLIYIWRDSSGKVYIVDELNKVPVQHRENLEIYRLSSRREAKKPRSRAPSRPATKEKELEEGTSKEERVEKEMEEVRSSIVGLRDRLEELKQDRETKRNRVIRKRGRGRPVVREKREIEIIEQEIETLTHQLGERMEALRSLEEEKSLKRGE